MHRATRAALALLAVPALGALACRAASKVAVRPPGHAILLLETTQADRASVGLLAAAGLREFWIPGASWDAGHWSASAWPTMPSGVSVVFTVRGHLAEGDNAGHAAELAALLRQRRLDAISRGWLPTGIHYEGSSSAEASAALLAGLRRELGDSAWLSIGGEAAAAPSARRLADLWVVDGYGQDAESVADDTRWDLGAARQRVTQAALQGRGILVRVALGAALEHQSGAGIERTTRFRLGPIARARGLGLREGFALSGGERLSYEWSVVEGGQRGPFRTRPRDVLRYRAPRPSALREFVGWATQQANVEGILFERWPLPDEQGGMSLAALSEILRPGAKAPALAIEILHEAGNRRSLNFRLRLTNPSAWASDLATLGTNYVELDGEGGLFGEVEPGGFSRYEFLRHGESRVSVQAMRRPERLRLYAPLLGAGESLESGRIELRGGKALRASAEFRLAGGEPLRAGPVRWPS
jgi:predicted small integral membrane protein